jgi:DNA repair protein RecO (recombination protein O)
MQEQISPAIVLFTRTYGESDKIVTFMSRDWGKMQGIAKGAKRSTRRFVNVLEPFTHVRLRFRPGKSSDLVFVVACELLDAPRSLAQDLDKFAAANYLIELADKLVVGREAGEEVYMLLRDGLFNLDLAPSLPSLLLTGYELHLLIRVGYAPHLSCCQGCSLQLQEMAEVAFLYPLLERRGTDNENLP